MALLRHLPRRDRALHRCKAAQAEQEAFPADRVVPGAAAGEGR